MLQVPNVNKSTRHIKKCSCGKLYTLDEFSDLQLPSNGRETSIYEYNGKVHVDVYRNCTCGSTIAISTDTVIKYLGD